MLPSIASTRVSSWKSRAVFGIAAQAGAIFDRALPGRAHHRDIAHPGRGHLVAAAIDARRILAAGDLQAARRAGEAHRLHRARRHVAQGHAAAAEQVGRAGQDLEGRHAAIGERAAEARILRPDAMLGPDFGADRVGRLIAVLMGGDAAGSDSRRGGCGRRSRPASPSGRGRRSGPRRRGSACPARRSPGCGLRPCTTVPLSIRPPSPSKIVAPVIAVVTPP